MTPCRSAAVASAVPRASGAAPQRQPAGRDPELPARDVGAVRRPGRPAAPGAARGGRHRLGPALEEPEQDQLLEHRARRGRGSTRACVSWSTRLRRPHPAQSQAAPEALARAPHRDRAGRVGGERRRHLLALERQRLARFVDDRHRVGDTDVRAVRFPLLGAHQLTGRVLEVRDQIGQLRRGLSDRRIAPRPGPTRPGPRAGPPSRAPQLPQRPWRSDIPGSPPAPGHPAR